MHDLLIKDALVVDGTKAPARHAWVDPATVGRGPKERVFDLRGNAPRLTTKPRGVHGLWINGAQVADETGLLPARGRPGRLLRDFAH
jgi:hypothetical protein